MSKILCTGGAGFIGSHLVDRLVSLKHDVVVLDNLSTGKADNINPSATTIIRDINQDLHGVFAAHSFDYVFHLAAFINLRNSVRDPYQCAQDNVMGSLNLILHCLKNKVKKFIFSSTGGAIYSEKEPLPWNEDTVVGPASPYGWSKMAIEQYLQIASQLYGLNYSTLRYSNVYGLRQNAEGEAGVISIFLDKISKGETLSIFGSGDQTRDFVHVDDVVNANLAVMPLTHCDTYNVSTNIATSVNELLETLQQLVSCSTTVRRAPAIPGEILHTQLDYKKLSLATGWRPQHLSLKSGLEQLVKEMKL
jgi:UDP-glucose 4-epimerase